MTTFRTIGLKVLAVALAAACWSAPFPSPASARRPDPETPGLVLTVRYGPASDLYSKLEVRSAALANELAKRAKAEAVGVPSPIYSDVEVTVVDRSGATAYRLERSGQLLCESARTRLRLSPAASRRLLAYAETLRRAHYGRLAPWSEARELLPRKSFFTITDLESGLSFRVQRRAGSSHADVQPVSKEDSAIMKRIYEGEWSWRRRAILVQRGNVQLAASMNGMPHGGDGIPDNGFKGHFCVHFLGSTSHRSDSPDPAHQLMIHKATGDLAGYFASASPRTLALGFVEALNQQDETMLALLREDLPEAKRESLQALLAALQSIAVKSEGRSRKGGRLPEPSPRDDSAELTSTVRLPVVVRLERRGSLHAELRFELSRSAPGAPWRIRDVGSSHSSLIP